MSTPQPNRLLDAALAYAAMGMAVFPAHTITARAGCSCSRAGCGSPGKHPRIKEWQVRATTDPAIIRSWWTRWPDANVCIATGEMSGVLVLDVDARHGGVESLKAFEQQHGPLPPTPTVRTGGDGLHF